MAQSPNRNWFVAIILLFCVLSIPVGLLGGKKSSDGSSDADSEGTNPFSNKSRDRIAVVRLTGMISDRESGGSLFASKETASGCLKSLRKAVKDKHIKAVLLRINSPGGTVPASQEIYDEISKLRADRKPVVVSMGDLAASGGYYISSAADTIVAEPGTLTGSIGVILSSMNLKGLGDKLGISPEVIKSGKFKDLASPYRPMTPEDKEILQALIMDAYDQFVTAVAKGRKMDLEVVKKLADGRVYSGRQALKLHLVDKMGGYDEAVETIQALAKDRFQLKDKLPVEDSSSDSILQSLLESSASYLNLQSRSGINPLSEDAVLNSVLPEFLNAQFYRQPLWIMQ
jgi:protease-4